MHNCDPRLDASALATRLKTFFATGPEGIIFDCDGVLVDSLEANIRYYNLLRKELGLPPISPEQESYVQMSTVDQALKAIIPPALWPGLREAARRIPYRQEILPLLAASPGLSDLLAACRRHGLRLGIHTNRMDGMDDVLTHCGLEGMFNPVITASCVPAKPDPHGTLLILEQWGLPAHQVLFIGDSSTDRDAAVAAGVPFLPYRNPHLVPGGCCTVFDDLTNALEMIWRTAGEILPTHEPECVG